MTQHLYTQNIDSAFARAGGRGADYEQFSFWRDSLIPVIEHVKSHPQREAEPIFSLPWKTEDLLTINEVSAHIADNYDTLVIAGMGGSSLSGETFAALCKPGRPNLHFIDNIDADSIEALLDKVTWRHTAFLVISKSGNTVESLAQMAVLLRRAKAEISNYAKHFYVLTVTNDNPLHRIAKEHSIRVLEHDPNLGGRFSAFSSVGLIPAAVAGLDIYAFRAGTRAVLHENFFSGKRHTTVAESAALHLALMDNRIRSHVMMYYGDRLSGLVNWHRQCWGESLGKCDKATTPIRARGTTDQHSQLQLYLDGPKDKLFTLLTLESTGQGEWIDYSSNDPRLHFLKGCRMGDLMMAEQRATAAVLVKNNCPLRSFTMKVLNEEVLGALLMHFTLEIILTAQLLKVNAFDQPAVEQGKVLALRYLSQMNQQPLRAVG